MIGNIKEQIKKLVPNSTNFATREFDDMLLHMKKYIIKLSVSERERLYAITHKGNHGTRVIERARILLESNAGVPDGTIAVAEQVALRACS